MHNSCVPDALGGQKKAPDALRLELQLWVSVWMLGIDVGPLEEQSEAFTPEPSPAPDWTSQLLVDILP